MFDCDGLLVETESRWTIAEERVCTAHGAPFSMDLKRRMLGSSYERAGEILAEWVGAPVTAALEFSRELIEQYRAVVDEIGVSAMPGVGALLERLADRVPIAVASNNNEGDTRRVIAASGLPDVFRVFSCAGGQIAPKPAPDLYLNACAQLGADPARSVAFEDSPVGATAATAAGMFVIGVPSTVGITLSTPWVLGSMEELDPDVLLR